jgi:hypothetical protein
VIHETANGGRRYHHYIRSVVILPDIVQPRRIIRERGKLISAHSARLKKISRNLHCKSSRAGVSYFTAKSLHPCASYHREFAEMISISNNVSAETLSRYLAVP